MSSQHGNFFTPPRFRHQEHFFWSDSDFGSRKCVLNYQNRFAPSLDGFWKKNKIFHVLDQFSRFCGATNFFDDPKYGIFALFSASTGLEAKIAKNTIFVKKIVAPHIRQKWWNTCKFLFFFPLPSKLAKNKFWYSKTHFWCIWGATNFAHKDCIFCYFCL